MTAPLRPRCRSPTRPEPAWRQRGIIRSPASSLIVSPFRYGVAHDLQDQGGKLGGFAEPLRCGHRLVSTALVDAGTRSEHRGLEQPWGDGNHPDAARGQVPRGGEGQADDACPSRRRMRPAHLSLEGGDRSRVDDDAAFHRCRGVAPGSRSSPSAGSLAAMATAASRSMLNVPTRLMSRIWRKSAEVMRARRSCPRCRAPQPTPAQLTSTRSGPSSRSPGPQPPVTSASLVTSAGTNTPTPASASSFPASRSVSTSTSFAPEA